MGELGYGAYIRYGEVEDGYVRACRQCEVERRKVEKRIGVPLSNFRIEHWPDSKLVMWTADRLDV